MYPHSTYFKEARSRTGTFNIHQGCALKEKQHSFHAVQHFPSCSAMHLHTNGQPCTDSKNCWKMQKSSFCLDTFPQRNLESWKIIKCSVTKFAARCVYLNVCFLQLCHVTGLLICNMRPSKFFWGRSVDSGLLQRWMRDIVTSILGISKLYIAALEIS